MVHRGSLSQAPAISCRAVQRNKEKKAFPIRRASSKSAASSWRALSARKVSNTVYYGSKDAWGDMPNRLDISEGWNFLMRIYRPGPTVLKGVYTLPAAVAVKWTIWLSQKGKIFEASHSSGSQNHFWEPARQGDALGEVSFNPHVRFAARQLQPSTSAFISLRPRG